MAGEGTRMKGRMKQAAGDLSGDRRLRREGTVDRAAGSTKGGIGGIASRIRSLLRGGTTSTTDTTRRSRRY